ncbi:hypothetical protein B0H10DRAFT_1942763 [Mycena sp. CBHHK59/15]|nr:hypothetical protein B0H10DRAFT_1942763 [Mycena sp. CBHHK59/15]
MDTPHSPTLRLRGMEITEEACAQPATPTHNAKYYIDDPMSIFLVENQLFKIHRHFLVKESDVFRWMFLCPPGSSDPDGASDVRAIPLPGVTAAELEALLDFFYTECVTITRRWEFQRNEAQMQAWIDLLSIATRFDFQRLRECAIGAIEHNLWPGTPRRFESIDPIKQIVLAEKHDIPHWLPIAYAALCQRPNPLEEWEAEQIGYRKTTLLARAREAVRDPDNHLIDSRFASLQARTVSPPMPGTPMLSAHTLYTPYRRERVAAIVNEVFFPPPTPRAPEGKIA